MFKRKFAITLAAVIVAYVFFACSNDEQSGTGFSDKPPVVSDKDGNLTKGESGINAAVTAINLYDFIDTYLSAIDSYSSQKYTRALPNEYTKGEGSDKDAYTIRGDAFGRAEVDEKYLVSEDWKKTGSVESGSVSEGVSGTVKYFDFSNSDKLFLGGAIGYVDNWSETYKDSISNNVTKVNGTINFQGAFKGKVVFNNVEFLYRYKSYYKEVCYNDYNGYEYCNNDRFRDTLSFGIKSGSFYVESNGLKFNLPEELLYYWDFWFPASRKDYDYGNSNISVKMPSVPSAPNGALSDRKGSNASVNPQNVNAFFEALVDEFYSNNWVAPRATENKNNWEDLRHGKEFGYYLGKYNETYQRNNSGRYRSVTQTMEYVDYSNKGLLYFGGGWGKAAVEFYKYTENPSSQSTERDTVIINGKVKFNGEFKGELNFGNFKYVYENFYGEDDNGYYGYNDYRCIGGSVKIGTLDVTTEYIEYVLKY